MQVQIGNVTFIANSALDPYLRVKVSSGKLVVAGATDVEVGTLAHRALAADEYVPVVPTTAAGTMKMVAGGAFAQYATVYGAADGKIDDVSNVRMIGMAMEAAAADGDVVEVLRQIGNDTIS